MKSRSRGCPATPARAAVFGLGLCLFLSGPAAAQGTDGLPARGDTTVVSSISPQVRIPGLKSPTTAFLWSFLGTAVPAAVGAWDVYRAESSDSWIPGIMLVGGLAIGPSLGHFYADRPGRAWVGIGIRLVAGAGIALAGLAATAEGYDHQ